MWEVAAAGDDDDDGGVDGGAGDYGGCSDALAVSFAAVAGDDVGHAGNHRTPPG